jgi:hypothetical protein
MWAPTVCPRGIPGAHTAIQKSNNPLHKAVDRLLCHLMPCDGCLTKNKDLQKTRVSPPMHLTNRLPAPAGPATSQLRVVRAVRSHQPSLRKERALLAQALGATGTTDDVIIESNGKKNNLLDQSHFVGRNLFSCGVQGGGSDHPNVICTVLALY